MARSHGDGGTGSYEGATSDRVPTRSRKRDKAWCMLCIKSGRKSRLQLFQIGHNEAMYLCTEETCPYPVSLTDDVHSSVVTRELSELKISSPQRGISDKSKSLKSFSTSMPIVVPVETQKIPTIPKEDMSTKRTGLASEPLKEHLLQMWMREQKLHFRNNSISHEDNSGSGKNGEIREKGDGMVSKRPRIRSSHVELDTDNTDTNRIKLNSHSHLHKLPGHKPRFMSTSSIRKIDKTLMQASGVDFNKKFEPFKPFTTQDKLPKETISRSSETESNPENKDNEANIETARTEDPATHNTENDFQESTVQNNEKTIGQSNENTLPNHTDGEQFGQATLQPAADLLPVNSLQLPLEHQEQWQHPSSQQGNGLPLHNGDIANSSLYATNLIPAPQYLHNSYHMMPTHPHYNNLIPPPTNYHHHTMPPSLQSPLSPIPSQYYYPDPLYEYTDQWDDNQAELELTKMLDSLDMPPSDQYDPALGILPAVSPAGADMYNLMDPINTMNTSSSMTGPYDRPHPVMQMELNSLSSPPFHNSIPINTSTPSIQSSHLESQITSISQEQRITDTATFNGLPPPIPTNGHTTDTNPINGVATFNNNEESATSSYQSPQSQGEYQSVSLVGSAS